MPKVDNPKQRKAILKRLVGYAQEAFDEMRGTKDEVRGSLSASISMVDVDFATELVMVGIYGREYYKAPERLEFLNRKMLPFRKVKKTEGMASATEITQARAVPIGSLVKVRGGVMVCLWHNDRHPSMHVYKDNHAYCFVCPRRADSIDIMMHLRGLGFVDAVRLLNSQ